jgi:hypothetical protein
VKYRDYTLSTVTGAFTVQTNIYDAGGTHRGCTYGQSGDETERKAKRVVDNLIGDDEQGYRD